MATAAATFERYTKGDLSMRTLLAVVEQQNTRVINVRTMLTNLDAEAGTIDNNYAAGLTAKEVVYGDYEADGASVTGDDGAFPIVFYTDAFAKAILEQHNAGVTDVTAAVAKLNGDDGISATDYAVTAKKVCALGIAVIAGQRSFHDQGAGVGLQGTVLQALVEESNKLTQDWHNVAAKLDADGGTADDYETEIAARTLTQASGIGDAI